MKRFLTSRLFTFILGAVVFSGITAVSAYTILANNIGYTPSDSSWKKTNGEDITNVKDAIDELYSKAENSDIFVWKNSDHIAINAQTIPCDVSRYKTALILVEYAGNNRYTGVTSIYSYDIQIGDSKTISAVNGDSNVTASRTIKFKDDGIEVSLSSYSGAVSGNNNSNTAIIDAIILY